MWTILQHFHITCFFYCFANIISSFILILHAADMAQVAGAKGPLIADPPCPKEGITGSMIGQTCSKEGLDKLCQYLTDAINSKDLKVAKDYINVLSALKEDMPNLKFHVEPTGFSSRQALGPLMTLKVNVEYQYSKEAIKTFVEIGEMATFADMQELVEEKLKIPCAMQNWIVEDKFVSTGNLTKKLSDYGIKKDSNDPPLYLYVVHPKKVNLSREELARVGALQPQATVHSDILESRAPRKQGFGFANTNDLYPGNRYQQSQGSRQKINNMAAMGVAQSLGSKELADPIVFMPPQTLPHIQPPPPPPPPPPKPVGWECPTCTFLNKPLRPGCEQCSTARPDDYKVPNDATLLDDPAKREEELLIEFLEQEKREQLQQRDQNYAALMEADNIPLNTNAEEFDCMICYTPVPAGEGVILRGCLHEFCKDCLKQHINTTMDVEVKCPYNDGKITCDCPIYEREIRELLTEQEFDNLHLRSLRMAENADGRSFHCRTPNCKGFCFYDDDVNEFTCQVCNKKNCILCKAIHEGMNCQEYQDDLKRRSANDVAAKATQDMLEGMVKAGDAMYCPKCKVIIQKKEGCDWIQCMMCKTEICWVTKGPRWGPGGQGDTSGGCKCGLWTGGPPCHPKCGCCH